jgi:PKD repeat protein
MIAVTPLPPPQLTVRAPRGAVQGFPVTVSVAVRPGSPDTGPIAVEWTLPDQQIVQGNTATFTPTAGGRDIRFLVRASPEGSIVAEERATTAVTLPVQSYIFPTFMLERRGNQRDTAAPLTASYRVTGNARSAPGAVFTYNWNFGDGTTLETRRPQASNIYKKPGTYVVRLVVSDQLKNTRTLTDTIIVTPTPPFTFNFRLSPDNRWWKAPVVVNVRPSITGGPRNDRIASFKWLLNGAPAGTNNVGIMSLAEPGTYQATLRVRTTLGNTAEGNVTMTAVPNRPPTCQIVQTAGNRPRQVRLRARCTDPDGRISGFLWNLGDGRTVKDTPTVPHEYQEPGTYQVTLVATDDNRAEARATEMVTVN